MPVPYALLESSRVNAIMQALQDVRQLPQQLLFLNRTAVVPAVDGEVMGRFTGYVTMADIIADDQQATVYQSGKITFESTAIPNIKHGAVLRQAMLNMLASINANSGLTNDMGIFSNYENNLVDGLLVGIRQRMEAMIVAMYLDAFTYSRLGMQINAGWGMPADLKITTAVAWDNAGSATPINDILFTLLYANARYGIRYNRITMSTSAFRYMVATTEFSNKARFYLSPGQATSQLPFSDLNMMRNLAQTILGINIVLYDARPWTQSSTGAFVSAPFLPVTSVILDVAQNDKNQAISDFANAVVTESIVAGLVDTAMIGSLSGPQYGPVSYATAPPDLNPPNITYWGVARGFPRKHLLQMNAALTVGSFADPIPVGPPF